jgi:hypothetical protein
MAICDISCNVTCDRFCPAQPICAILCYAACQGFCQEGTGHTSDCDVCSSFCKDQNPLFKGCCVTCAHANCTDAKHRKVEVHS